jgi:hypothetical protein
VGAFAADDVVLVRFPLSGLSQTKLRPAIVLADPGRGDLVLWQVTSRPYGDAAAEPLALTDLLRGRLPVHSATCRPTVTRPVKAALRAICADALTGAPLERELKGLWRFA